MTWEVVDREVAVTVVPRANISRILCTHERERVLEFMGKENFVYALQDVASEVTAGVD